MNKTPLRAMASRSSKRLLQGLLWGTLIVHASGLWRPIFELTKKRGLSGWGGSEGEQLALCLALLISMAIEPLAYLLVIMQGLQEGKIMWLLAVLLLATCHAVSWLFPSLRRRVQLWGELD